MTAKIIDGKAIAKRLTLNLSNEVKSFTSDTNITPCLAVIMAGDNPASSVYVKRKIRACNDSNINSIFCPLDENVSLDELLAHINKFNSDEAIHGLLVQLPLPKHLDKFEIFEAIDPMKDVDVFHPENVGLLVQNRPRFLPCTPHGIQIMLKESNLPVEGKHVVVINRSDIVGKPLSSMLIQDNNEFTNATVTVCHDKTQRHILKDICRDADVIVVAVGIPEFLTAEFVKPHHVVIDVGINKVEGRIVGDVHSEVFDIVNHITCVPGGCGPMTVFCLMENTFKAAKYSYGKKQEKINGR